MGSSKPKNGTVDPRKSATRFHLKRACGRGRSVLLSSPTDEWSFRGEFRELIGLHLLVDAERVRGDGPILPGTLVVLAFSDDDGVSVGVAALERIAPGRGENGWDRFVLRAPSQLATERGRRVYRVPSKQVEGLRASLGVREGRLIPAVVRDLSVTGISVRVAEAVEHGLSPDDVTSVALAFDGQSIVLDALVRRATGRRVALCFHRIPSPEAAPDLLRRMVNQVEGTFLRSRARRDDLDDA